MTVLRWGGLTSIGGSLLFIFVFGWVLIMAGPDPAGLDGDITRFAEIKSVRVVENGGYLAVMALWVPMYLALRRRLESAAALFGGTLGVLGLGLLAAGALPHVVASRLSDLYHAAGASAADKATLMLVWQGVQGIFDALLLTGLLLLAVGVVVLGSAMRADPGFGKAISRASVVLGGFALACGVAVLVDPASLLAALGLFALIGFHFAVGWKAYRLAR